MSLTALEWFIIDCNKVHKDTPYSFWSTKNGWGEFDNATGFSEKERHSFELPGEGFWILRMYVNRLIDRYVITDQ
jgi:hypothetical protein